MIDNWNFLAAWLAGAPGLVLSGSLMLLLLLVLRRSARRRRVMPAGQDPFAAAILQAIRDLAIFRISKDGRIETWTPAAEALLARPAGSAIGQTLADLIGEDCAARLLSVTSDAGHHAEDCLFVPDNGGQRHLHVTLDLLHDPVGRKAGFAVTARDDTVAVAAEAQKLSLLAKGQEALQNLPFGIALFDREERLVFHNPAWRQIMRLPQVLADAGPHFRETLYFALGRLLQPRAELEDDVSELYRRYRDSLIRPGGAALVETFGEDHAVLVRTTQLEEGGFVVSLEDISDRLQSERSLAFAARHDVVTGLPNLAEYEDYLADARARAYRKAERLTMLTVDIGRFRSETARFGTVDADALLRRFAARLAACLIQGEFIARTEKDRLTVLKVYAQPAELDGLVHRLRAVLGQRFEHQGEPLTIPVRLELQALGTRPDRAESELDKAVSRLSQAAKSLASGPLDAASAESLPTQKNRAVY